VGKLEEKCGEGWIEFGRLMVGVLIGKNIFENRLNLLIR
jgi:hypothetical protein